MSKDIKKLLRESLLDEALITIGGIAYPKDNNVVIFAGGSGSGKGFIKDNLLGIDGIVFDIDKLKTQFLKSKKLRLKLETEYGVDVDNFDFKNPNDVSNLHNIISSKGIPEKVYKKVLSNLESVKRKPNLIFDITLNNVTKLHNISFMLKDVGYETTKTHLVWVLTDYYLAKENNKRRDRVVPHVVFKDIHKGVSRTINDLLHLENLNEYVDGDFWIVFNNPNSDTHKKSSDLGGGYIDRVNYIKIKSMGQPYLKYNEIEKKLIDKINQYVHNKTKWGYE